eukprot:10968672-Alexandrium_andersonii.AAC.1
MRRRRVRRSLEPKLLRHPSTEIHQGRLIARFEQELVVAPQPVDAGRRLAHRVLAQAAFAQDRAC